MKNRNADPKSSRLFLITAILLSLAGIVIYAGTFQVPFVLDDTINIKDNPHVRMTDLSLSAVAESFKSRSVNRPLANLSFAFNYYFHRYQIAGYHAVNLIIHIITACLVFVAGRQTLLLTGRPGARAPLFGAMLWLVNPVHTQSVTYIVQRMNSLAAMFYLLALVFYIQARQGQLRGNGPLRTTVLVAAVIISGLLALSAKEIAATLPLFLLLYEWFFFRNLDRTWLKRQLPWIFGVTIILAATALIYTGGDPAEKLRAMYDKHAFTPGQRLLTQPGVILYYLTLLIFPHPDRLNLIHDFPLARGLTDPLTTVPALAALALIIIVAVMTAGKHRIFSFALLWFVGNLAIESSVIGLALIFEHRAYLPSVFLFIALGDLLFQKKPSPRAVVVAAAVVAVVASGLGTYQRNRVWQDDVTLWRDNIAKAPRAALPRVSLGMFYLEQDRPAKALPHFENAVTMEPDNLQYRHNLAVALAVTGETESAVAILKKIIARYPRAAESHYELGKIHLNMNRRTQALEHYQRAIEINPYYAKAYNDLGGVMLLKGQFPEAISHFEKAITINPGFSSPRINLAVALKKSAPQSALAQLAAAEAVDPQNYRILMLTGDILISLGETSQAEDYYEKAAALSPGTSQVLTGLGFLYAKTNRLPEAITMFKQLATRHPDNPSILYNLACLFAIENDQDRAVHYLRQAVVKGYDNRQHLESDEDLESIRHTEAYQEILETMTRRPE